MQSSIVVPMYNVKPYLRACLDSVLAQTCPDWEARCADDGTPQFPAYNRFVLSVFDMVPAEITVFALFYVPQRLKRRGFTGEGS